MRQCCKLCKNSLSIINNFLYLKKSIMSEGLLCQLIMNDLVRIKKAH